jgi:hypothetical protein
MKVKYTGSMSKGCVILCAVNGVDCPGSTLGSPPRHELMNLSPEQDAIALSMMQLYGTAAGLITGPVSGHCEMSEKS